MPPRSIRFTSDETDEDGLAIRFYILRVLADIAIECTSKNSLRRDAGVAGAPRIPSGLRVPGDDWNTVTVIERNVLAHRVQCAAEWRHRAIRILPDNRNGKQ